MHFLVPPNIKDIKLWETVQRRAPELRNLKFKFASIGIDCLFRLGPSHIPHPGMRHTAHMGLGPHGILAPHAESGSCCPLLFHLTSHKPPSHCPRKGPEPAGGTRSPCQGSGHQALAFLLHKTKEAFLCITATIPGPWSACNHGFQLSALTSPWGSLLVNGPQWGPLILQETSLFLLTWSSGALHAIFCQHWRLMDSAANAPWGPLQPEEPSCAVCLPVIFFRCSEHEQQTGEVSGESLKRERKTGICKVQLFISV